MERIDFTHATLQEVRRNSLIQISGALPVLLSVWGFFFAGSLFAKEEKPPPTKPAPIPAYAPTQQPLATGEYPVGVITIVFRETALLGGMAQATAEMDTVKGPASESGFTGDSDP